MIIILYLLFSILLVSGEVAIVEFTGDIQGSIRFDQLNGVGSVTITSNLIDVSGAHGSEVAWGVYNGYVDVSNSETCDEDETLWNPTNVESNEVGDLTSSLGLLQLGFATYTTSAFSIEEIKGLTLSLGDTIECVGIDEVLEALRLEMLVNYETAIDTDELNELKAVIQEVFNVNKSYVSADPYYPVVVNATLTNLPDAATSNNDELEYFMWYAVDYILELNEATTELEVTVTDTEVTTTKDVYISITSFTNGTHHFLESSINANTFAPQVLGVFNWKLADSKGITSFAGFTLTNVGITTSIVVTQTIVDMGTDTAEDIETIVINELQEKIDDLGGNMLSYTVVEETKSPTVIPTSSPTTSSPSKTPSVSPTVLPTQTPSIAPFCVYRGDNYLGDPSIVISETKSMYDEVNDDMLISVGFPYKYNLINVHFNNGGNNTYELTGTTPTEPWTVNDGHDCSIYYTATIPWSEITSETNGIIWNGASHSFDGRVDLTLNETVVKEGSETLGDTFYREVYVEIPFFLQLQTTVIIPIEMGITVDAAALYATILTGLTVLAPNGIDNGQIFTTFITEVPFPWKLNENYFSMSDTNDRIVSGTDVLSEVASSGCNIIGEKCRQFWEASWDTSSVCDQRSNITVDITAQYLQVPPYVDEEIVSVEMIISTQPSCVQSIATIDPIASLKLYDADDFDTATNSFLIDQDAWGRILVDAPQDISSIDFISLTIVQDGFGKNLRTVENFQYVELDRTVGDVATIDFSFQFSIDEIVGELTGKATTINAEIEIHYVDGSRRLLAITQEPDLMETQTIIVLFDNSPCIEPVAHLGDTVVTPCTNYISDQATIITVCKSTGWHILLDHCTDENSEEEFPTTVQFIEQDPSEQSTVWMIGTLALCFTVTFGSIGYYFCVYRKRTPKTLRTGHQIISVVETEI